MHDEAVPPAGAESCEARLDAVVRGEGARVERPRLWFWRHPRAEGAEGRCIGVTDLPVDRRRAKRLAHRIRRVARRERLPRVIHTSDLQRAAAVGRWLRRWGWRHVVDARLREMDFGDWDGLHWSMIERDRWADWDSDFEHHAPGGAESVYDLRTRVDDFVRVMPATCLVIGHAGWAGAWQWLGRGTTTAACWPAATRHGALMRD